VDVFGSSTYGKEEVAAFGSAFPITSIRLYNSNLPNGAVSSNVLVGQSNGRFFVVSTPETINTSASGSLSYGTSMGIGTSNPTANLDVRGDALISGTLSASNIIIAGRDFFTSLNIATNSPGAMYPFYLYKPSASSNNTKTIVTNDTNQENHVLASFDLYAGRYLISANIPYTTGLDNTFLNTSVLATIGLYATVPSAYTSSQTAIAFTPMQISGVEYNSLSFQYLIDIKASTTFCLAVNGKGSTLTFGRPTATNASAPVLGSSVAISGMGVNDVYSSSVPIAFAPTNKLFLVNTASTSTFDVEMNGNYEANGKDAAIHRNGIKLGFSNLDSLTDFKLEFGYNSSTDKTTFTTRLTKPASYGDIIDVSIQPIAPQQFAYQSGYYYQKVTYTSPWGLKIQDNGSNLAYIKDYALSINSSNIRSTEKLFVEGGIVSTSNIRATSFFTDVANPLQAGTTESFGVVQTPGAGDAIYRSTIQTTALTGTLAMPTYFSSVFRDPMVLVSASNVLGYGKAEYNAGLNRIDVAVSANGLYNVLVVATKINST